MREYTEKEIQEIREIYEEDDLNHGCGYWSVCAEHDCFCSMDAPTQQGFSIEVWDRMSEDYRDTIQGYHEEMAGYDDDEDWPDEEYDDDWPDDDEW